MRGGRLTSASKVSPEVLLENRNFKLKGDLLFPRHICMIISLPIPKRILYILRLYVCNLCTYVCITIPRVVAASSTLLKLSKKLSLSDRQSTGLEPGSSSLSSQLFRSLQKFISNIYVLVQKLMYVCM